MSFEGWVCTHRASVFWEWYKTPGMFHLFSHLIMMANHKDGKWQGIPVKRGQLITGRKSLSEATGMSEQQIRTCLTRLERTNEISKKSTKQFTIITICNYGKYQSENEKANQRSTNDQPTINQRSTTNNNDNNDNNETIKDKRIPKNQPPKKNKFGTFENVLLTDEEYQKLKIQFNGTLTDRINALSEGIESKGYRYKSHYATILSWARMDSKRENKKQAGDTNNGFDKRDYRKDATRPEDIPEFLR